VLPEKREVEASTSESSAHPEEGWEELPLVESAEGGRALWETTEDEEQARSIARQLLEEI
jgi:hypothetical protein